MLMESAPKKFWSCSIRDHGVAEIIVPLLDQIFVSQTVPSRIREETRQMVLQGISEVTRGSPYLEEQHRWSSKTGQRVRDFDDALRARVLNEVERLFDRVFAMPKHQDLTEEARDVLLGHLWRHNHFRALHPLVMYQILWETMGDSTPEKKQSEVSALVTKANNEMEELRAEIKQQQEEADSLQAMVTKLQGIVKVRA